MNLQSLADVPRRHAATSPSRIALQCESRRTTYGQWDLICNRVANALEGLGAPAGARVGYLGKNSDIFFHALFGCAKIGAVLVPINWRLALPEICFILKDANCKLLFIGAEFGSLIETIRRECPGLQTIVGTEDSIPGVTSFHDWLAGQPELDPRRPIAADDVVLQLYTSGTTGLPKGAQLTHRNLLFSTKLSQTAHFGNWRDDDICVLPLPLFHAGGVVFGLNTPCAGGTVIVVREAQPPLILEAFRSAPGPVTRLGLVPAVIKAVLDHPEFPTIDFSNLRTLTYGGSPITLEVLQRAINTIGPVLLQLFGMTETATVGTALLPSDHDPQNTIRLTSCGRPLPGVDIRIVASDGKPAQVGKAGEVRIRCGAVMAGYWNRPEATAAALKGGWYHTGDVGYFDADGYLYIQDRLKDMIISGGENVYPAEVERVLIEHPAVADVAIFGIPDAKWGEAVKAAVVLRAGQNLSQDDLIAFAQKQLGAFKCPKSVDFIAELPRNASGKVLKRVLREPYWTGVPRNVG
ncbi:long-chain-fatty-acid--CoA ligase [Bradyrhizobium tropiciagri]|uniref:long-chain-fatty-acid--CoA ligase n=1 Tax=Bradyrhizobium tropiciagri TaxID=312253 RepID=UPI001BACCB90|nr:long-chain-fatty-acid--CoA ligase [Bradyrhizobium tropiciagri]MBR0899124.1 long-chain-fatty-acid--CoA ligase [Bradyrhizobium tropiciagri]